MISARARACTTTLLTCGLALAAVVVGPTATAAAAGAPACPDFSASLEGDKAVTSGAQGCEDAGVGTGVRPSSGADDGGGEEGGDGDGGPAGAGPADAPAPDPFEWARTPDCPGNAPGSGSEALCGAATMTCPDPGDVRYVTYQRPRGSAAGPWAPAGVACLTPAEAAVLPGDDAAAAPVIVVTGDQFRELPLASASAVTEPPGGALLISVPTVVHAVGQVQVLPSLVLGVPVAVRATPATYAWDFGDGTVLGPVADPGAPWPAGPHAHAYPVPGRYDIVMSTTYTGEFSVDGGPWEPIDGTSTVASPPQAVVAHSARSALVADTLG